MKRSNIIGIIAAAVVIIVSVVLISWYLRKTTPMLIQGTEIGRASCRERV